MFGQNWAEFDQSEQAEDDVPSKGGPTNSTLRTSNTSVWIHACMVFAPGACTPSTWARCSIRAKAATAATPRAEWRHVHAGGPKRAPCTWHHKKRSHRMPSPGGPCTAPGAARRLAHHATRCSELRQEVLEVVGGGIGIVRLVEAVGGGVRVVVLVKGELAHAESCE